MNPFPQKRISFLILVITSLVCSRTFFALLDDPEGPNLLIVVVLAAVLYVLSWAASAYLPLVKQEGPQRLLSAIVVQVILVIVFYFLLR